MAEPEVDERRLNRGELKSPYQVLHSRGGYHGSSRQRHQTDGSRSHVDCQLGSDALERVGQPGQHAAPLHKPAHGERAYYDGQQSQRLDVRYCPEKESGRFGDRKSDQGQQQAAEEDCRPGRHLQAQ
jgi:hypothetical protein